jgi:pSer/pThr/pTyr-binding forkhead associated (FHA) protein
MSPAYLEIVEGPGAGRQIPLEGEIVLGRDQSASVQLEDPQVSRRHCQVTPGNGGATVNDLGSRNGTFVNNQELVGPTRLDPGDDLLVGVTVLELRGVEVEETRPLSGVRAVPDGLRVPERAPDYVPEPAVPPVESGFPAAPDPTTELEPYLDVKVKGRTRLAPLFLLGLAAAFVIAFELTEGLGSLPDFEIIW